MAKLAIVLVLYRGRDQVGLLWDCPVAQRITDWRLIVVDNDPADGAGDFLPARGDPRVSIDRNDRNEGFVRAVNAGLRRALAEWIERCLVLNPDIAFDADILGGRFRGCARIGRTTRMQSGASRCVQAVAGFIQRLSAKVASMGCCIRAISV